MPAYAKKCSNDAEDGKELLGMLGRFEPAHPPLSFSSRLAGMFRSIVKPFILSMHDAWYHFFFRPSVALQFVGRDRAWHEAKRFQRLSKESLGRFLVTPRARCFNPLA
jgi:hypothetical protein